MSSDNQDQGRALGERADRFRLLVESAIDTGIMLLDTTGHVISWNQGAARITGWSEDEILGRSYNVFYPANADIVSVGAEALDAARRFGLIAEQGLRIRKDGSEFHALVSIAPLFDDDQVLLGYGLTMRDVSPNQKVEAARRTSELRLRSILETVLDGIVVIDSHGIIQSFSPAAARIFEYSAEDVIGINVSRLMPEPYRGQHDSYIDRYLQTGEKRIIGLGRVVVGLRRSGETFPMELAISEFSVGGERFFTGMVRDLTEREKTEKRLQNLQAELLHVSRLSVMGRMASTLAHELNQPLTAVGNYLQATRHLLKAPQPDLARLDDLLAKAGAQTQRAGEVIRRLRAFVAKGETERRAEDLNAVVEEATAFALVGGRLQGIRMSLELASDIPQVTIDKTQIQQVIVNLVRNAVDAMEAVPERLLHVTTRVLPEDRQKAEVAVTDTGPGLSPDVADKLFQPFITSKPGGMGLGLSICREIVEAHGGQITAEKASGGGTTFRFTLLASHDEVSVDA
jgi:two-component system sensor kinase FixL